MPRKPELIPEKVLQDIHEVTRAIVREESFEAVTIRKVCEKANISTGTFYNFYQSKSQLLANVVDFLEGYYKLEVVPYFYGTGLDKLKLCYMGYINRITTRGLSYCRNNIKFMYEGTLTSSRRKDLYIYKLFSEIIDQCKTENSIKNDIENDTIIYMFLIYLEGLIFDWCFLDGTFDLSKKAEETFDLFIKSFQ